MSQWFKKNNFILWMFLLFFTQSVLAGVDLKSFSAQSLPKILTADTAFNVSVTHDGPVLKVFWQIAPQCYLYRESIKINLLTTDNEEIPLLNESSLPAGETIHDPYFGAQVIYRNNLSLSTNAKEYINSEDPHSLTLQIHYQGCSESGFCYPPLTKWFVANIDDGHIKNILPLNEAPSSLATTPVEPQPAENNEKNSKTPSLIPTIITFYFLGILLTFTPCVLPMIPILFVVIVGQGHLSTRRAFRVSLCYVLSMAFTYAIAGIVVATLGKNLQASLQKPLVLILFSALFVYLGLVQLGIGKVSLPGKWRDWLNRWHMSQTSGSYVGAAIMGILATLIASPCVSAPMIGALSYISQSGNIVLGGSALFAMGLGMGTLLLIIGTLEGKYLPKKGPWMHAINQAFAIILFGLSLWLMDRLLPGPIVLALWGLLLLLAATWMGTFSLRPNRSGRVGALLVVYAGLLFWGSWSGGEDPLKPLSTHLWKRSSTITSEEGFYFDTVDSLSSLAAQQELAQKRHRPLVVIFHADWCVGCKHFEHDVLANAKIQKKLSSWEVVLADMTPYNEANQLLMKKFDLIGPPVVLFFDKNGNELTKYRVTGDISKKNFALLLDKLDKEMQR